MGDSPQLDIAAGGKRHRLRLPLTLGAVAALAAAGTFAGVSAASASTAVNRGAIAAVHVPARTPKTLYVAPKTATPIKHLVVIFDENVSFDHYFGTYPYAANTDGQQFTARPGTPDVNGLYSSIGSSGPTGPLLTSNPNGYNPERLSSSQALTCDQNHSYGPEQEAEDNGAMDGFVTYTQHDTCSGQPILYGAPGLVMDYYDGNTTTAMWNYAQYYAMSDNNWDPAFGPSSPGALNLISGDTGGGEAVSPTTGAPVADTGSISAPTNDGLGTIFGDADPAYDDCSDNSHTSTSPVGVMTGENIGNLLNEHNVTWGWFQGGFAPTSTSNGYEVCGNTHENIGGVAVQDYVPHHDPFQFYASTANPQHLPPTSESYIGMTDQANHQYDISDFYQTLQDGNMPAVSFLKPPAYQNGHPGNSDPLDEQTFLANTINQIEQSPDWKSTAIVITYDDSDGWYDHQPSPIVNGSNDPNQDQAMCSSQPVSLTTSSGSSYSDRCGFGVRLPLVVISPYTQEDYVSHVQTDTSSIIKFIEDNWLGGQRIGNGSWDSSSATGSLNGPGGVLDTSLKTPNTTPLILSSATGEPNLPAAGNCTATGAAPATCGPYQANQYITWTLSGAANTYYKINFTQNGKTYGSAGVKTDNYGNASGQWNLQNYRLFPGQYNCNIVSGSKSGSLACQGN